MGVLARAQHRRAPPGAAAVNHARHLPGVTPNPIYLADLLLLVGLSLRWEALSGVLLTSVLALILPLRFIEGEEARLRKAFPAEAEAYFARARRWL